MLREFTDRSYPFSGWNRWWLLMSVMNVVQLTEILPLNWNQLLWNWKSPKCREALYQCYVIQCYSAFYLKLKDILTCHAKGLSIKYINNVRGKYRLLAQSWNNQKYKHSYFEECVTLTDEITQSQFTYTQLNTLTDLTIVKNVQHSLMLFGLLP